MQSFGARNIGGMRSRLQYGCEASVRRTASPKCTEHPPQISRFFVVLLSSTDNDQSRIFQKFLIFVALLLCFVFMRTRLILCIDYSISSSISRSCIYNRNHWFNGILYETSLELSLVWDIICIWQQDLSNFWLIFIIFFFVLQEVL